MTLVGVLGSLVYVFVTPLVYKAETLLLPPKAKEIQSFNVLGLQNTSDGQRKIQSGTGIKPEEVFNMFKKNLISRNLHKKFILKNGLIELLAPVRTPETKDEELYRGFSELFNLESKKGITSFSIELNDAELAAEWVNDLVAFVEKETINILVEDTKNSIVNHIRDIEHTISSKRVMAEKRREDLIIRYTEHAEIANKLGMIGQDVRQRIQTSQMNVDIATATTPLYYLGYEALMTEIGILRNRKSDDPFISGLRDLQERFTLLRSIKFDKTKMKALHIDQPAYPPKSAIKPNRRLIVYLTTVVGLFSGIFLVFFIEFVKSQRKKHSG